MGFLSCIIFLILFSLKQVSCCNATNGGDGTDSVAAYQKEGAPLIPVSTSESQFHLFIKRIV
jgi:hypothetical protein